MVRRFDPDRNIARNLLRQPGVTALVETAARDVAATAAGLAGPGDFASTLTVSTGSDRTRPYARVISDDPGFLAIEFGTTRQPAKAPLRRAVEAAGLKRGGGRFSQ